MSRLREAYLDNIRWVTVLMVLIYHVCYLFNGVGVPGGIPGSVGIPAFDAMACIVYPWFMALLFVVAGMSARYSLQKRTGRQFIRERAVKLLVPSTLGLFVLHWVTGYLNIKMGGGLPYIPGMLLYPISALSGIGPLWFIQMLFVFSCILVLIRRIDKRDRIWNLGKRASLPVLLLLFAPIYGAAQILNMPVLTMYRFGIYFAAFLMGYCIFSHNESQEALEKVCIPVLCLAIAGAVLYMLRYCGSDYTSPPCLQSILTNLYLWTAVLAAVGCFKKYFDRETAFTRYMAGAGFGLYILHYPVLTVACYILRYHFALPEIGNYLIAFLVEITVTLGLYEGIRRIPVLRFLVLGMEGKSENAAR